MKNIAVIVISGLVLSGCNTWSASNVRQDPPEVVFAAVAPQDVQIFEGSLPAGSYDVVTDLVVSVNKTTAFNANPTREQVVAKLQEEAASIGANAVINAEISEVQVSLMSWGTRNGKGQAVRVRQ
ncbi:MAG: heavy metal-binding domain-containing protein [Pseudomonadota bacterium]